MARHIGDGDKTDFDETRRLLYMALLAPRTKRYNLAGTLVNALAHHHVVDDMSADAIADHVVGWLEHQDDAEYAGSEQWLRGQISRISQELGD